MGDKASDLQTFKTMPELFKKSKLLAFLGPFLVTFCALCCFFYLDYRALINGFGVHIKSEDGFLLPDQKNGSVEFLSEEGGFCDVFDGDWVWDETYPLYQSRDCRFLDDGFRCSENGRPDLSYTKWRWQPKGCNLPRFDARVMLEKLRNKRLVFVGDSIGRNQWESLLCMLSAAVPHDKVYEVNGNPITKHQGFLVFKFAEYNSTVEYYKAPFLVPQGRPPPRSAPKVKSTLKLDRMDWSSSKWKDADVLVLNTGRWWNYEKTIRGGCYFQEGEDVKMKMGVDIAYKKALDTAMRWIQREINATKTRVFFRSYAPVHFSSDWRKGGGCHLYTLPAQRASSVPAQNWKLSRFFFNSFRSYSNTSMPETIEVLNITTMTSWRQDGHASLYYLGPKGGLASLRRQDCSHWCLPGVPDSWNELLYALLLKGESSSGTMNSSAM